MNYKSKKTLFCFIFSLYILNTAHKSQCYTQEVVSIAITYRTIDLLNKLAITIKSESMGEFLEFIATRTLSPSTIAKINKYRQTTKQIHLHELKPNIRYQDILNTIDQFFRKLNYHTNYKDNNGNALEQLVTLTISFTDLCRFTNSLGYIEEALLILNLNNALLDNFEPIMSLINSINDKNGPSANPNDCEQIIVGFGKFGQVVLLLINHLNKNLDQFVNNNQQYLFVQELFKINKQTEKVVTCLTQLAM